MRKHDFRLRTALPAILAPLTADNGGAPGGGAPPPPPPAAPPAPPPPPGPAPVMFGGVQLSADNATYQTAKKYADDPNAVFDALRNAESFVGMKEGLQFLKLPADRSFDKLGDVFTALGKPKDAAGYGLKEDPSRGLEGPLLAEFGEVANRINLLKPQADALMDWIGEGYLVKMKADEAAEKAELDEATKAMNTHFGGAENVEARMKGVVGMIDALVGNGPNDVPEAAIKGFIEHMNKTGLGNNLAFMQIMDALVKRTAEPGQLPGEKGRDTQAGAMTPAEAQLKLAEFERVNGDALGSKSHPDHKTVVAERMRLMKIAHPAPSGG